MSKRRSNTRYMATQDGFLVPHTARRALKSRLSRAATRILTSTRELKFMTRETDNKEPKILGRTPDSPATGVRIVGAKPVEETEIISKTQPPKDKQ